MSTTGGPSSPYIKAKKSLQSGDCIELARGVSGTVWIRDSQHPDMTVEVPATLLLPLARKVGVISGASS